MENKKHPFETTLGLGPYQFIGVGEICFSPTFGARYIGPECERGAGTCAHCGHAIKYVYVIETAEKRRFGVGSDCILKVSMPVKIVSQIEAIERKRQKEQRQAKKAVKGQSARNELKTLIDSNRDLLSNSMRTQYNTWLSYAEFCVEKSSDGGIVLALKAVQGFLKNSSSL